MGVGEQFQRVAIGKHATFKDDPASWVNPKVKALDFDPGREEVPDESHLNSFGDPNPPDPGNQTFSFSFSHDLHSGSQALLDDILDAVLGETDAGGALTAGGGGTNDTSHVAIASGTPSAITRGTLDNGTKVILFGRRLNSGTLDLDITLPTGRTVSDIDNPSELDGACYDYLLGDEAPTFGLKFDQSGRTGQIVYTALGAAFTGMSLVYEEGQRLALAFEGMAAEWDKATGADGDISDPARATDYFLSRMADIWLVAQGGNPTIGDALNDALKVKKLSFQFGSAVTPERWSQGLNGGTSLPGSDIGSYAREPHSAFLEVLLKAQDDGWYDVFDDPPANPYKCMAVWYPGAPNRQDGGAVPSKRIAAYWPELIPIGQPRRVTDAGQRCHQLQFLVRRRLPASTYNLIERFHLAFFGSL
jgi:hypothetical protein